jgi:hypothetical protein
MLDDPDLEVTCEVELMLDPTNERHIIRTAEY